jgi:hypothetical protein
MLVNEIARLIELRNSLVITPCDFDALTGTFLVERVTGPSRELEGVAHRLAHEPHLGREDRYGCREVAGTAGNILGWCSLFRRFDCGPLEAEVTKLVRHNPLLRRLQQTFPRKSARVVDGRCDT